MRNGIKSLIRSNKRQIIGGALGLVTLITIIFFGSRAILVNADAPVNLVIYAFSTQEEVFMGGIFPAFEKVWEAETGQDLIIEGVFGPSEAIAEEISKGAPADVAVVSLERHVSWLKIGRLVRYKTEPTIIGSTPMIIIVRPGNPMGITDFTDLTRPGLFLIHADPKTWQNVRLLATSAQSALNMFEIGVGDALITYEQDALLAQEKNPQLEIVVPNRTILAQPVAVVVDDNVTQSERVVAEAFIEYLISEGGQRILARYHMRPINIEKQDYPEIPQLYTVDELGGWPQGYSNVIHQLWKKEIQPDLILEEFFLVIDPGE
jgi:sulfate transport system substrate-binding protein